MPNTIVLSTALRDHLQVVSPLTPNRWATFCKPNGSRLFCEVSELLPWAPSLLNILLDMSSSVCHHVSASCLPVYTEARLKEFEHILELYTIFASSTPWAAPLYMVLKILAAAGSVENIGPSAIPLFQVEGPFHKLRTSLLSTVYFLVLMAPAHHRITIAEIDTNLHIILYETPPLYLECSQ